MNVEELNRQRMEKQVRDANPVFNRDERVMGNEIKKLALEVAADNGVNNSTGKADSFISKMSKMYNQTFLGKTELKSAMQKEWNKMNVADSKIKDGGYRIEKISDEREYRSDPNALGKYAILYDWVATGDYFNSFSEALRKFNKVARTKGHEETIESYKKLHRDSKPVTLDEFNRLLRKATK